MKKRTKIILISIGALAAIFVGALFYQAYRIGYEYENFDKLYNQSLSDLESGKISMLEYCDTPVHSEAKCNEYKNLHGIK